MNADSDEKLLIARAEDAIRLSENRYSVRFVGFLTPAEAACIRKNVPCGGANTMFFGGYEGAERTLFVALPEYADESEYRGLLSAIEVTGRDISGINHRDCLGSLMGLGIKREKIGDILVYDNRCIIFVLSDIADYIISNLEKIGRIGVKLKKAELGSLELPARRVEEIFTTVSAMRLDSVTAAGLKTSRSKALPYITGGRVSVNWEEVCDPSHRMKEGDVFSVRGAGRFRIAEEIGRTKKDRVSVKIEKLL